MAVNAQDKVEWRGVRITARQRDALRWAERKAQKRYPGISIVPTQGSWSDAYSVSAGTHSGAGAIDIRTRHYTDAQRAYMIRCIKDAGQAAWYRTPSQGFVEHAHILDRVTTNMASGAKWQVAQYDLGRTGLASNLRDTTYRPSPPVKWNFKLGVPVKDV